MPKSVKHTKIDRDEYSYVGNVNHGGVFVRSGSLTGIAGGATGSISFDLDAVAARVKRVEIFHSGGAPTFSFVMENRTPNTGASHDPRHVVVCYSNIPGSDSYDGGIDQIEDLVMLTDTSPDAEGKVYCKFMPFNSTNTNDFKYLFFFEAMFVYVNKDGSMNG